MRGVPAWILRRAGPGFYCGAGSFFRAGEDIRIGRNVFFGLGVHVSAPCVIGDDVLFGSRVAVVGGDHRFDLPGVPMNRSGRADAAPVVVEEEAWVGHGAILMAGVRVGRGAIVAAGAVVTKDIPPCEIWGGTPARALRPRFPDPADRDRHLAWMDAHYSGRMETPSGAAR
jgi:chloramphenicol O-acetyltransferase type B